MLKKMSKLNVSQTQNGIILAYSKESGLRGEGMGCEGVREWGMGVHL